jgi:predicted dehydrogenase
MGHGGALFDDISVDYGEGMKKKVGIIMHGATGRVGVNQHLKRAISCIVKQGLELKNGDILVPDPILVGRDEAKLEEVARQFGISRWTSDLESALHNDQDPIYFNCVISGARFSNIERALKAGKHVFCEKPLAPTFSEAKRLTQIAETRNRKNGVVMSDLWLPGFLKLKALVETGFFGEILAIRGDFGYWVHEGDVRKPQRPSWNYRKNDGGGIVTDMMCHWHYILTELFGKPRRVCCVSRTLRPTRWDENDQKYDATADDMALALVELDNGVLAQLNMSWCTRVRRDDLIVLQVDGSNGSAVAGIHDCHIQTREDTPSLRWEVDGPSEKNFLSFWKPYCEGGDYGNPFNEQWKLFLRHVAEDGNFPWNFALAADGVDFIEACTRSSVNFGWETLSNDRQEFGA